MNKIWSICLIICMLFGLWTHQENTLFQLLFTIPKDAFQMSLTLCLNACFFNGLLNIANQSGLLHPLSKALHPLLKLIFKNVSKNTLDLISVHFISNIVGLGSLATISGIKAMKALKQENKDQVSQSMMTLFILNTTGLSLFPSTIVILRQSYQTGHATDFIPFSFLISLITLLIGLGLIHLHYER